MWKEERQGEEVERRRRLRRGTRRKSDKFETDKSLSLSSDLLTVLMSLRKLWSYMIITRYIIIYYIMRVCVFRLGPKSWRVFSRRWRSCRLRFCPWREPKDGLRGDSRRPRSVRR